MGKMKELFMKTNYPYGDLEREYLFNDTLAQEQEYEEYSKLKKSQEANLDNTKIEVSNGKTRIEISKKDTEDSRQVEIFGHGF